MNDKSRKPAADSLPPAIRRLRLIRNAAFALVALVAVLMLGVYIGQRGQQTATAPSGETKTAVKIGGPFQLTDHTGKAVTEADFRGRSMLIFFGYTYCPDVCPTTLYEVARAMNALGDKAAAVTPVFISVDPERDTPARLKDYVANFHPSIVGLTGTPDQIKQVAKEYRVYYAKVPDKAGDPNAYLMDHSSVIYLMGPDGAFKAHFSHDTPGDAMAAKLKTLL